MWVLGLVYALSLLAPYLLAAASADDRQFLWLNCYIADNCHYLSFARQAEAGHFTFGNPYTTEPQASQRTNLLLWAIGTAARFTSLPPLFWFHFARLASAVLFVRVLYGLLRLFAFDPGKARLALLFVCFSSGLGWLWLSGLVPAERVQPPVDTCQPEAVTFLVFYTNTVFAVSMLLMVVSLYCLARAAKSWTWRWTLAAGVAMGIIANVHSYDFVHLAAAWGLYELSEVVALRRIAWKRMLQAAVAFLLPVPVAAQQYYVYLTSGGSWLEGGISLLSPPLYNYVLGYGLLFFGPLAWLGLRAWKFNPGTRFFLAWAVAGLAVIYSPVSFQRRMLMGTHVPLAVLFASVLADCLPRMVSPRRVAVWTAAILAVTVLSNVLWVYRDLFLLEWTSQLPFRERGYVSSGEWEMLAWIDRHLPANAAVLAPPSFSLYAPPFAGCRVYCGHWCETPAYAEKAEEVYHFFDRRTSDAERLEIIGRARVNYVVCYRSTADAPLCHESFVLDDFVDAPPHFLRPLHVNESVVLYEVVGP